MVSTQNFAPAKPVKSMFIFKSNGSTGKKEGNWLGNSNYQNEYCLSFAFSNPKCMSPSDYNPPFGTLEKCILQSSFLLPLNLLPRMSVWDCFRARLEKHKL